jgi:DNA repair ATPase RecN
MALRHYENLASRNDPCDPNCRMIESFQLTGFRCFESISLEGLTRVNVITGTNASGKSALLAALLVAARGTPETLIFLDNMRGVEVDPGFRTRGVVEARAVPSW